jgi:hypothetical protein
VITVHYRFFRPKLSCRSPDAVMCTQSLWRRWWKAAGSSDYPLALPGTSKWNKVEHRLFSHITMNWRGRPLTSHEVIVQTIAATTTRTGLRVRAELDTSAYDTGVKVSDRQMDALPLTRHDWHGDWNYTLRPEDYDQDAGAPDPFDRPSPGLAWLCHPALTGAAGPGVGRPDRRADEPA